jgi:hypothetical protein
MTSQPQGWPLVQDAPSARRCNTSNSPSRTGSCPRAPWSSWCLAPRAAHARRRDLATMRSGWTAWCCTAAPTSGPAATASSRCEEKWNGDRVRDEYDKALVQAFEAAGKPVFGICRGLQLLNVAFGGTLYQDINTQKPEAFVHRDAVTYDQNFHSVDIVQGSRLRRCCCAERVHKINSIHHQGIKDLAPEFAVEATVVDDGIVEAIRHKGEKTPTSPRCNGIPSSTSRAPAWWTTPRAATTSWRPPFASPQNKHEHPPRPQPRHRRTDRRVCPPTTRLPSHQVRSARAPPSPPGPPRPWPSARPASRASARRRPRARSRWPPS